VNINEKFTNSNLISWVTSLEGMT